MAELLFEVYNVPSVAFGVDALFSFDHNSHVADTAVNGGDGLVISSGTSTTHVIPVIGGKGHLHSAKRYAQDTCHSCVELY